MTAEKEIRIFYSWQSDSPEETNKNGIRNALDGAIKKNKTIKYVMRDEATKGTAGAVNVAEEILRKIKQADIFIADISTTLSNGSSQNHRTSPNPNVVFELGFAVGELGWDRIILLFNTALGNLKQDLPFDFSGNRVSTYYWRLMMKRILKKSYKIY